MMEKPEGPTHLPVELWTQIFCLLPVEPLLLLRRVCKSFLSIIDDPDFASLHLRSFPDNLHQTLTLVLHRIPTSSYTWKISTHSFEIRESNGFALCAKLDPGFESRFVTGSLDGLYLLNCKDGEEVVIRLWNPSTRQIRSIPLPKPALSNSSMCTGLAYDSSCRDYKILYIAYNLFEPLGVWVYGVKTRSWTTVNTKNSGMCTHHNLPYRTSFTHWSLFFEGGLLWTEARYSVQECGIRMVRFEVGTHKFRYYTNLPLIAEKQDLMKNMLVTLDGGSTLGLCGLDGHDQVSIWAAVSAGDAYSWVRRCVIPQYPMKDLDYGISVRVSKNDELTTSQLYYIAGTLNVLIYNLRTRHCQQSEIAKSMRRNCFLHPGDQCAYVQSLIKL